MTSARIKSRLANLPIYVYDLRDSLTYKPLNLGSTNPIALSIVTHMSTYSTARAEKQARPKAALACNYITLL